MPYMVPISRSYLSPQRRLRGPRRGYRLRRLGQDEGAPPPPQIDPTTGQPLSPIPPPVTSYGVMPQPVSIVPAIFTSGDTDAGASTAPSEQSSPADAGGLFSNYIIPGSSIGDILTNAATGSLTPAQATTLAAQEQQGLTRAGMNPVQAQKTAQSDVNTVLTANNAAPSQASFLGIPVKYLGWAALGLGGLILFSVVRR